MGGMGDRVLCGIGIGDRWPCCPLTADFTVRQPCTAGKFSNATNAAQCGFCPAGSFAENPGQAGCERATDCDPGEFVEVAATAVSDSKCTPCQLGTQWQVSTGAPPCAMVRVAYAQDVHRVGCGGTFR
jgi:hypothetical protein